MVKVVATVFLVLLLIFLLVEVFLIKNELTALESRLDKITQDISDDFLQEDDYYNNLEILYDRLKVLYDVHGLTIK